MRKDKKGIECQKKALNYNKNDIFLERYSKISPFNIIMGNIELPGLL